MLSINEIFGLTIQGEGKRVGKPSVFIRFSKCNFTCSGFSVKYTNEEGIEKLGCDTFYAVDILFVKDFSICCFFLIIIISIQWPRPRPRHAHADL